MNSLDVDDEDIWVEEPHFSSDNPLHIGLRDLESSLRCHICSDFYRSPVTLSPCNHCFCSECIRTFISERMKTMKKDVWCPECKGPINTAGAPNYKCLSANVAIASTVSYFQGIRKTLRDTLVGARGTDNVDIEETGDSKRQTRSGRSIKAESSESNEQVVLEKEMKRPPTNLKYMNRPAYKNVNKKRLQELCEQAGLPTHGPDKDLINRHQEFVNLYNAEVDSRNPRPAHEIAKEVVHRENARRREMHQDTLNGGNVSNLMENLKNSRKNIGETDQGQVSSGNKDFDKKLDQGFEKLIAEARKRMKKGKSSNEKDEQADAEQESSPSEKDQSLDDERAPREVTNEAPVPTSTETSKSTPSPKEPPRKVTSINGVEVYNPYSSRIHSSASENEPVVSVDEPMTLDYKSKNPRQSDATRRTSTESTSSSTISIHSSKRESPDSYVSSSEKRAKTSTNMFTRAPRTGMQPWSCSACTYLNKLPLYRSKCEMCSTQRSTI